ncbi:unnamed protein product [Choristocarpus tenellus]
MARVSTRDGLLPELANQGNGPKSTSKLRKSCDLCFSNKKRCDGDGQEPCRACRVRGIACLYSAKERRGPKPKFKPQAQPQSKQKRKIDAAGLQVCNCQRRSPTAGAHLSPSGATGLVGLVENHYLNAFVSSLGCVVAVQEDKLRGAIIHVLSGGSLGPEIFEGLPDHNKLGGYNTFGDCRGRGSAQVVEETEWKKRKTRLSAAIGCLWAGIGMGALLSGLSVEDTQLYAARAREAMTICFDHVSEDVLRGYMCLAYLSASMDDYQSFSKYLSFASAVAESLSEQHLSGEMKFQLEIFKAIGHYVFVTEIELPHNADMGGVNSTTVGEVRCVRVTCEVPPTSDSYLATAASNRAGTNALVGERRNERKGAVNPSVLPRQNPGLGSAVRIQGCLRDFTSLVHGKLPEKATPRVTTAVVEGSAVGAGDLDVIKVLKGAVESGEGAEVGVTNGTGNGMEEDAMRGVYIGESIDSEGMTLLKQACGDDLAVVNMFHLQQIVSMGYCRVMELAMGVACSSFQLMCNLVAGAPWEKVVNEAKVHADTADYILETVLGVYNLERLHVARGNCPRIPGRGNRNQEFLSAIPNAISLSGHQEMCCGRRCSGV